MSTPPQEPSGNHAAGVTGFVAGTSVLTERGPVTIETLIAGDAVTSRSGEAGEHANATVLAAAVGPDEVVRLIGWYVEDDPSDPELGGTVEHVVTTDDQRFWVPDAGWTRADKLHRDVFVAFADGRRGIVLTSSPLFRTEEPAVAWVRDAYGLPADDFSGLLVRFTDPDAPFQITDEATAFPLPHLVGDDGEAPEALFRRPTHSLTLDSTGTYAVGEIGAWARDSGLTDPTDVTT